MEGEKNELALQLDTEVLAVIGKKGLEGFQMAYEISRGINKLDTLLTAEYMKEIMPLQNSVLGFKTDKPGGYEVKVVKTCLIDAVITGVQPYGNQFNIISGNMYVTREGFTYLLRKQPGLWYEIIAGVPVIGDKTATIENSVSWSVNGGERQHRKITFVVKVNAYMGSDAVIGKADRKTKCWLFNTINNVQISDADADEMEAERRRQDEEKYDWVELQNHFDLKKHKLGENKRVSGQRILTNKEKTGYARLKEELDKIKLGD